MRLQMIRIVYLTTRLRRRAAPATLFSLHRRDRRKAPGVEGAIFPVNPQLGRRRFRVRSARGLADGIRLEGINRLIAGTIIFFGRMAPLTVR